MTTTGRLRLGGTLCLGAFVSWCLCVRAVAASAAHVQQAAATSTPRTGADVYRTACATCHGADGRGSPRSHVGFAVELPDFTDCAFATPEADADWFAIVHAGGRVRGFDRQMPAFGGALADEEIRAVVTYIRGFCTETHWPPGDLNLPRPLVTEKAFPENEALLVASVTRKDEGSVGMSAVYEQRLGARSQWEIVVPIAVQQRGRGGPWTSGIGDIAAALKHVVFFDGGTGSIVSVGGEVVLPTGRRSTGAGKGTAVFEPFVSAGQAVGRSGFVQAQAGVELPADREKSAREAFWRIAAGQTFFAGRFNREWSPMLELAGARELVRGAAAEWDVVPQLQLSLSRRHHVLVSAGVQVPIVQRAGRGRTFHAYLLWDWFDGGFFTGW